jgi:hypothetical protein
MYGREERCVRALVGRATGKRSLGRPRNRWEDNIKRILKKPKGGYGLS